MQQHEGQKKPLNDYKIVYSKRRSLSLEVTRKGEIIVRAPYRVSESAIVNFVKSHEVWLQKALERQKQQLIAHPEVDKQTEQRLRKTAREVLTKKVQYYSKIMNLYPISVKITGARTRFGSCSAKNAICFSFHLMEYPDEAIDYVVVHELAHIKHKNHGKMFYKTIECVLPDYKERIKLLK